MSSATRTGSFPIGFRRGWSDWQKDLRNVIDFALAERFAAIDVGPLPMAELRSILDAGLAIGSVDVRQPWTELCSPDADKRKAAAEQGAAYVQEAAALGVKHFFVVVIPEDEARPRSENMDFAIDGYGRLCNGIKGSGAKIEFEGWPGRMPRFASLGCTPADLRILLKEMPAETAGVNYDPSHLIRLGVDPYRFLTEFGPRVGHVHAKDTQFMDEELYEHGNLQPATHAKPHAFGGHHWRYTLPGHGVTRWDRIFTMLVELGYQGGVSVELEDANFNGTQAGEKRGLIASRDFLVHA